MSLEVDVDVEVDLEEVEARRGSVSISISVSVEGGSFNVVVPPNKILMNSSFLKENSKSPFGSCSGCERTHSIAS